MSGGGKGGGSAPQPVDPRITARAQTESNEATARLQQKLNSVNQVGPYGTVNYDDLGDDRWQQTITLAPEQQALLDSLTGAQGSMLDIANTQLGNIGQTLGQPLNFDSAPAVVGQDDLNANRQQVIDALYGQYKSRLDPQFGQAEEDLLTRLTNQGISTDSDAYQRAVESFGRTRNDAYNTASNTATVAGGEEQSRLYGMSSNARERAIQEIMALRSQPINEITALLGSGGQVGTPQFSPPPQTGVNPTDVAGISQNAYNQQLAAYNANQQGSANAKGGIGGLLGTGVQAASLFV